MADDYIDATPVGRWLQRHDVSRQSRGMRSVARALAVLYAVGNDLVFGRLTLHASSLVYTTLLSLVPLLALAFSVLKGLGVHNQIAPLLRRALAPLGATSTELVSRVVGFVDNVHVGVLGAAGLGFLLYTSVSVGRKVEEACNEIWHVAKPRSLGRSVANTLTILLGGPILLFSAFGLTASVMGSAIFQSFTTYDVFSQLVNLATQVAPLTIVFVGFVVIYRVVPNARVRWKPAFAGALAGTVAWAAVGWVFTTFVASSASYTAIYSAFASLILLLLWLQAIWLILLVGCAVAFYVQRPQYLVHASRDWRLARLRERLAFRVMQAVTEAQYRGEPPLDLGQLQRRLELPFNEIEAAADQLEAAGLLARTAGHPPRILPAQPLERMPLKAVWDAARGGRPAKDRPGPGSSPTVAACEHRIDDAVEAALQGVNVKTLADIPEEAEEAEEQRPLVWAPQRAAKRG
jgi:membrane protein